MRLLHIDSSPQGNGSVSRDLAVRFRHALKTCRPDLHVVYRDLTHAPPPAIDAAWIEANGAAPDRRSPAMQATLAISETYIEELFGAEAFLFSMPMHNFSVPANFKCYIDHALRAGRTFRLGASGAEGLVRNRRAMVVTARGAYYSTADPASDFQEPYMRKVLAFIGVSDVSFVHAEGMDLGEEARCAGLRKAFTEIDERARAWAETGAV